jgi:hypothetical protein
MSATVDIEPEYPGVVVDLASLTGGRVDNDLAVIAAVSEALDRAGHPLVADAFPLAAAGCRTWDDLMLLIRCTVTVL